VAELFLELEFGLVASAPAKVGLNNSPDRYGVVPISHRREAVLASIGLDNAAATLALATGS
jgi:hypothetical protein